MSLYDSRGGGLGCGCHASLELHAQDKTDAERAAIAPATSNAVDLRRARQRARQTFRGMTEVIMEVLQERNVRRILEQPGDDRALNVAISQAASQHIRTQLLDWLTEREKMTMGRAFRAAMDEMQKALPQSMDESDLVGVPRLTNDDQSLVQVMRNIDSGLLTDEDQNSLAQEVGDEVTRQLRVGVANDEPVFSHRDDRMDLATRVDMVLNGPDYERSEKQEAGVTGQSKRTKGELIAHDSIQDAHNQAATRRYLQNGFRYVVYDATCDTRTTDLCRRLGECNGEPVVIDLQERPWLVPPNHPYCRSGIRPVLEPPREPITEGRIADGFLQDIWATESFRPTIRQEDAFRPTALTRQMGQTA